MKKAIAIVMISLVALTLLCGAVNAGGGGDENYNDHSQEISQGPGESPDEGMAREEPRTRNKDS
ncbi:MAG: hypothetical protein JW825_00915 [Candidatus Methanofastidiosa archaeon]|nr:hypothetical protein [Candidatus Methanofastidiosa archaeon]